jgi:catechol 2,3-dioxygenase-like lactoylglutathione lyase family enzyme
VKYRLEMFVLPVSDVDRAKAFYSEKLAFNVDVDFSASEQFRIVQLTPQGSECSITIGTGLTKSPPGSYEGMHLVVNDIEAAQKDLTARGIDVGDPFHFGDAGQAPGLHPDRADYGTYLTFQDPDGNSWLVQEVRSRSD